MNNNLAAIKRLLTATEAKCWQKVQIEYGENAQHSLKDRRKSHGTCKSDVCSHLTETHKAFKPSFHIEASLSDTFHSTSGSHLISNSKKNPSDFNKQNKVDLLKIAKCMLALPSNPVQQRRCKIQFSI